MHAEAEEQIFYPALLQRGKGPDGDSDAKDETLDAIKDHNEIRDAVADAGRQAVGSDAWWKAVAAANKANSDHMGEEEREGLTDFRRTAGLQLRHDLAVRFITFETKHVTGVTPVDKSPEAYVAEHGEPSKKPAR